MEEWWQDSLRISGLVMESDSSLVPQTNDLHDQMTVRKERLSFLIHFINDNEVLSKV